MSTEVTPVVTFENTPEAILEYLTRRTDDTVGDLVDRSDVVIVGRLGQPEYRTVPIRPEDAAALQTWLVEEQPDGPYLTIHVSVVQVERWLRGPGQSEHIEIVYVEPATATTGGPDIMPIISEGERGLLFLQRTSSDVPFAMYLPQPAYQFVSGENGVRNFKVTDFDDQGEAFTRDETAHVYEMIGAVEWFTGLEHSDTEAGRQALADALDSANPRIVRHAIRALARRGNTTTGRLFTPRLTGASQSLAVRLMLGLWMVGERGVAKQVLESLFEGHGKYTWLSSWGIEPSSGEAGGQVETLHGPDPTTIKGD